MKDLFHISAKELSELGIVAWGYTPEARPGSFERFLQWLPQNGKALPFLAIPKNVHYRSSLDAWWPKAQTALVFLFSYAPAKKALLDEGLHRIAGYTVGFDGEDYHVPMKERLHMIGRRLQERIPLEFRHSHDTEAILERDLAHRAGLGWFGKNSLMINRLHGSYFMIGSLILDQKLDLDVAATSADHCGQCRACVDACPTQAIDPETRTLTASQCISTWTIEDRGPTQAPSGTEQARGELFGCDICQDVCPWNHKLMATVTPQLEGKALHWARWFHRDLVDIADEVMPLTNRGYLRLVKDTVFGRPGRPSFLRTLSFWMRRRS